MNRRTVGIVGTLLIHLSVLLYLLWPSVHPQPPPPPPPPDEPKPVQVELLPRSVIHEDSKLGPDPGIAGAPDPKICANKDPSYEGIGIIHSYGTDLVLSAPAEYPAYKAGIRVGDMLVEIYRIEGTKFMFVHVNRHGNHLKFKVPIEQICFRK
jgi:hypothetical protein